MEQIEPPADPPPAPSSEKSEVCAEKSARPRNGGRRAAPPYARWLLLSIGWLLIVGGLLIGPLPGPGPLILVPLGLALVLRNSAWAKRVYVRMSARHAEIGRWGDWALGRRHHQEERPPVPAFKELAKQLWRDWRRG